MYRKEVEIRIPVKLWDPLMEIVGYYIRQYSTFDIKDVLSFDLTNRANSLFLKQKRPIEKGFISLAYEESITAKEVMRFLSDEKEEIKIDDKDWEELNKICFIHEPFNQGGLK